jgi:hypothetical protein
MPAGYRVLPSFTPGSPPFVKTIPASWNARCIAAKLLGCPKCARGEGHQVFVLTVTYPGGRTRQISVRRERVEEVRRWLANYQELKEKIEAICELNHDLLRPERAASKPRKKQHD